MKDNANRAFLQQVHCNLAGTYERKKLKYVYKVSMANVNQTKLPLTNKQLQYRRGQLQLAKQDPNYLFVLAFVPKSMHPPIPKANDAQISLRRFRGQVTAWRKYFHALANQERRLRAVPPNARSTYHFPSLR